jgi:outer membrane receptor protein involved in Fe transport
MLKKAILVLILCLPLLVRAESGSEPGGDLAALLSLDLASLGELQIFTVSRAQTDSDETTAVVSVITAEEIARRGYNSIYEVMQHIPGIYYNTSGHFENLTSRGISQTLTSFLLLIDGHSVNNKSAFGISVETLFPTLSDVARIEVVRGGGSVLWGTDAGLGIIHVITKSGRSIDKTGKGSLELFADYEVEHQRKIAAAVYGKRFNKGDLMVSLKTFDSDEPWGAAFGLLNPSGAPQRNFINESNQRNNANWDFDPSFEVTLKSKWKDFSLKGQITRFTDHSTFFSEDNEDESDRNWIELGWSPRFSDKTRLESRLFFNDYQILYKFTRTNKNDEYNMRGGGAEAILYHESDDYSLTSGMIAEVNELEYLTSRGSASGGLFEAAPTTTDKQAALFAEGTYSGIEDWRFTLGGRLQYSEGILEETIFLPRAAVIYAINNNLTGKYVYNVAEVAPATQLWLGGSEGHSVPTTPPQTWSGADEPQHYDIHDLQLIYNTDKTNITLSLFYIEIEKMIHFLGRTVTLPNGSTTFQNWINIPGATSKGFQLEFTHQQDVAKLYGDYTYADAEFKERFVTFKGNTIDLVVDRAVADESLRLTTTPKHIWNMGADIDLRHNLMANLHYHGYSDLLTKWNTAPTFENLGTEHFFDATLLWRDAGIKDLDLSLSVKNILDNDAVTPDNVFGCYSESVLRRRIGMSVRYKF